MSIVAQMSVGADERRRGTATIYRELGFAPKLGRGLFVLFRSVGLLAHAWEQRNENVRIRGPIPRNLTPTYTGPTRRSL